MKAYTVTAVNPEPDSENRIHSDEVALRHGFRGGLVPGVTVYGYLCPAIVDALGARWAAQGRAEVRFQAPVYDGESVRVTSERGPEGVVSVRLENGRGELCATARADLLDPIPPPASASYTNGDTPPSDARPPATPETLSAGLPLGALRVVLEPGQAHPATILHLANRAFTANFRASPWIHAGSSVQHFQELRPDDTVEVRGRVERTFERKGHRFVELDVLLLADGKPAARVTHTAIYELAVRA